MQMLNNKLIGVLGLVLLLFVFGCKKENEPEGEVDIIADIEITKNPSGYAPLTAEIELNTKVPVYIRLRVIGKNGEASDIVHNFPEFATDFTLPVLGLYPAFFNEVELIFFDENNSKIGSHTLNIQTGALIDDLPEIEINSINASAEIAGYYFVNYFGYDQQAFPQRAFIFDQFGDIRWFLNYALHDILFNLFYDFGMVRLQNGNLLFGDGGTNTIYEINMFGEIQKSWGLQNYGFHHTVIERQNGNFLVTVNDPSKPTVEDVIIEIDRVSGGIVNTWDLNESLDNSRKTWETDLANLDIDWFHANGLASSDSDNAIIVSGRTQGTVKLSENNEVIWILAPHKGWETSGNGADLNQFLLQPVDNQNMPIINPDIIQGNENHEDFEWAWYQHSPVILPNGHLMVFDNGENRNFTGNGGYSRAVEYEINETNKTVKQIWDYGKDRGQEAYSKIVSKVNYIENSGNILFTPGAVDYNGQQYGKVIEVNYQSDEVLFEATITPPRSFFIITFHNTQPTSLYGN